MSVATLRRFFSLLSEIMKVQNDTQFKTSAEVIVVRVVSYDEGADTFKLSAVGFSAEDERDFPVYSRGAPDFDDFEIPGAVLPFLVGEFGEPSELVGNAYALGANVSAC